MTTACGICGAATDAYLCTGDAGVLQGDLNAVPGALVQLRITHAGGDRRTAPGSGRSVPGPGPLPWNEAAGRLITELDRHVRSNTRIDNTGIPAERIALRRARQVNVLRRNPAAPAYAKELHRLLERAKRVIDRRATLWTFGVCPCGQELLGEPDAATVVCSRCNTGHDAVALKERQWAAAAQTLVTQAEAAQWLAIRYDVDPLKVEALRNRVNQWVQRKRFETSPGVVNGKEQQLVLFGAVDAQYRKVQAMNAAKATRNHRTARSA